ncbi:MAG TPA: acyl-CoA dehydratase activase [Nitrospirota bacterium]|nr:acyl-CoA dehydratase activase [Nitrospirota bacterium]
MKIAGLDAGSVSVKLVVLDGDGNVLQKRYRKHRGHPVRVALGILKESGAASDCSLAVTGSAGKLIAGILGIGSVNEIIAQAYAVKKLHPRIRTVIEMGGEDSKLILLDEGRVKDFSMNSACAAGTGSFLDQQAERLRLSIEEFSELSLKSKKPPRIAGRCSVFAKSDMIHLQQIATPVEEIAAGLCFAVARNFRGSIARGRSIVPPVSFQGGVAANKGMVRAFREVLELDELFVPPDFALMGALGAAMKAADEGTGAAFRLDALEEYLQTARDSMAGHPPLLQHGDAFFARHVEDSRGIVHSLPAAGPRVKVYMGIDIGSISTNVAVIDSGGRLLSKRYLMTAGRPIEAVRQGLRETAAEIGDRVEIAGVGTTGSGRYMIADYVGADIVKNEITAQATAATFIAPTVDTIFEIGGQDSKYISLENGVIVDFEMNKACAAGTGSFLEEQAEKLSVSVKEEFAECALSSACPSKLGERCTVFMENSLMASLQKGTSKNDLFAGLAYSIVQNYINRVVAGKKIGKNIFFQGGVAFNKSVVAAFEKYLGQHITVPPNHDVTGAIGMALIAMRHMLAEGRSVSSFKGLDLAERRYEISSFGCSGCSNLCEINRVTVEGERQPLFYGGRCEKYDINRKDTSSIPDLFKFRDELLWKAVKDHEERRNRRNGKGFRARLGIPYLFSFNDNLPFWVTLLSSLGFDPEVSPRPNRQIVDLGLESVLSEACFPVKVAIGHIRYLKEQGVDAVFLPSFVNLNGKDDEYPLGAACPHTQSIPYVGRVAVTGVEILAPIVDRSWDPEKLANELRRTLKRYGVTKQEIRAALAAAEKAQAEFQDALRDKGKEVLAGLTGKAVAIVGRSYNALERGMNLRIPEKLATLGVLAVPMDMLPVGDYRIAGEWPGMYWRNGQRMLRAARFLAHHDKLYPLVVGSFSCGPDSFILKYFKEELRGKPFLHVEIDEHSADAGAITRCEAFLDSIARRVEGGALQPFCKPRQANTPLRGRLVYIPPMSDHAYALAAAFERCGVEAEMLPPSDRESVEIGMKYVSGKECYPCAVTTGDMMKKALSKDFYPSRSAFFMPSGSGPCRFGQYNVFHRQVLERAGLNDTPVFAPNQDEGFFDALGAVGNDFALQGWKGIVAIELLTKCLHESRPYELRKGSSDELYRRHLEKLVKSLRGRNGRVEDELDLMRKDFEALPKEKDRKPLVGIVGEIFVRSSKFSNEDLVRKIEALGGEAWLAPVEEWVYYANLLDMRHSLAKRECRAAISTLLTRFFQKRVGHRYAHRFEGHLRTLAEPSTSEVLRKAAPYVHHSFEGEAILSIGKAVDFVRRGAHGVVNAMPFGCMPGTIVTALMRAVTTDFGLPVISIAYDGTESPTNDIQLEAFMDQARVRAARCGALN